MKTAQDMAAGMYDEQLEAEEQRLVEEILSRRKEENPLEGSGVAQRMDEDYMSGPHVGEEMTDEWSQRLNRIADTIQGPRISPSSRKSVALMKSKAVPSSYTGPFNEKPFTVTKSLPAERPKFKKMLR